MKHVLDWSAYKDAGMGDAYADIPKTGGDFAKAISVCINSRKCETEFKGVMCPSYRVLQDTRFSTGGRVRLLKAALNGELGSVPFQDSALVNAMDLCLGCKGCKRECENEVDMAMIKIEYLAQRLQTNKLPMRTRMLANLSRQLRYFRWIRYLTTLRNRIPWFARLTERLIGLSAQRQIPVPVAEPFSQRQVNSFWTTDISTSAKTFHSEVVLLIDTFTNHFAPENAEAAIAVLNRAGYRVIVARASESERPLCCGRTLIANGMVHRAQEEARRMLSVLLPHVEAGRQIIGLEPACLLAIRDDYKFLGLGDSANKVASKAILFEEFIAKELAAKRFALELKPVDTNHQPLLVHGHCHQKAVGAMKSMRKVLKLIPDLKFEFIESTCCGMAGSFGIEEEHAEVAMQMAEQSLLPSLREQPDARVVANGFSCRHQINEGVKRSSMHIALLLREAMA
jgi:glycerol-3-phosphate dehydrogenase subunit C